MGTLDRLRSIRSSADEAADGSRAASVFYFIFTSFNSLISDVLAESSRGVNEIYDAFARLKEATGIERAFLCGALALPPAALAHLPSRAFAELVIGMQQQRSYEATIRATAPPKLLDLVRAGFEYAPELREVQSRLLETFDVASLRETLGADRCWQMLTDHIDKLERLQGLLHRELQAQRETELATEAALQGDAAEASLYGTRALLREHTQDERMIGLDELVFKRRIGSGSAGVTYLASFEGGTCAVKIATGGGGIDDWKREVRALSRLRHPNIIRCMGVIAATPSFGLVLEFCEGGDLSTRLTSPTPPGFLLAMATGTAAGMLHLHHRGVLHRDLKGGNILIDGSHGVKITDFGLAAFAVDETRTGGWMTAETGTYRWMAPEVCLHEQYSKSADVFSFGCVLFELITHELPWADRPPLQAAVAFGLDNLRPSLPSGVPPAVAALTHGCWLRDATARPTFASIHAELESLSLPARLTPLERTWLDAPDGHPIYSKRRAAALPVGDATPRPATTDHGQQQPAEQQPAEQQPAGPHAPLVQLVPACFDALVAAAVHCFDALRGARPGYVFKHGPSGVGYYMENGNATGGRPARGGSGNFLEHLEAVEARDVASPGFRPPVNNRTPEWARVQQEGLTEARISYGAHLLPGNGMYDGQKVTQHSNGLGAGGQMEERRRSIHSSQISFADPAPTNGNQRWQTSSSMYQRGGGVPGNAAAHAMPPAGGRSNLAGPSTSYGTQNPASLTSVF